MRTITSAVAMSVLDGTHVAQHRRPAEPVALDQGDLAAELVGHERRLVAAGSATDDHHLRHVPILPQRTGGGEPGTRLCWTG